jgi:hypothetical protein
LIICIDTNGFLQVTTCGITFFTLPFVEKAVLGDDGSFALYSTFGGLLVSYPADAWPFAAIP